MKQAEFDGPDWGKPERIRVMEEGRKKTVLLSGRPYMSWQLEDEASQRIAIAQIYELGMATQEEIAKAFHIHVNSVYNYIQGHKVDGAYGLISQKRGPKGDWRLNSNLRAKILVTALKENIKGYEAIQARLKERWSEQVSIENIRRVLLENGLIDEQATENSLTEQRTLFDWAKDQEQLEFGFDWPKDSKIDLGQQPKQSQTFKLYKSDAARRLSWYSKTEREYLNQLERGQYNMYAGALIFAPLLGRCNFVSTIERIIKVRFEDGYNLRQLALSLFYFDLFGIKSIEDFKSVYPEEFGLLIGRLNSPSVYTLRRFLNDVADLERGEELIEEFSKQYLKQGLAKWGVLYIDEHFLPYYGAELVSSGYFTIRNMPLKGSYNFLAVDEEFNPVIFLIRPSSENLIEKIKEIIHKTRRMAKDIGITNQDLTVIFDRGGYKAELFRDLDKLNVRYITWAKYFDRWVNDIAEEEFKTETKIRYDIRKPDQIRYFETEKTIKKYGKMRTIVIQSGRKKKRAAIYTNDKTTGAPQIIELICRRWGHENFNKTMKLDHRIDYFPGYDIMDIEEQPMIENPEVKQLKQQRTNLKSKLAAIKGQFGHEVLEKMGRDADWEQVKQRRIKTLADIEGLRSQILLLQQQISKLPNQMRFDEAHPGTRLVRFNYERKRFLDNIKTFAYRAEKQMCKILLQYYPKPKEIWPALEMIYKRGAYVKLEGNKLSVRLRRFRNPTIDYVARHLCENINQMRPRTLDKFKFSIHLGVG